MSGTFVGCDCDANEVTLSDAGGNETTTNVQGATVTLNGNAAKLSDLKTGDAVKLNGDPVSSVVATR